MGVSGQLHPRPLFPPGKRPFIRSTGGWVDPKAGAGGCRKSRLPTGILFPYLVARSKPLNRLRHRGLHEPENLVAQKYGNKYKLFELRTL